MRIYALQTDPYSFLILRISPWEIPSLLLCSPLSWCPFFFSPPAASSSLLPPPLSPPWPLLFLLYAARAQRARGRERLEQARAQGGTVGGGGWAKRSGGVRELSGGRLRLGRARELAARAAQSAGAGAGAGPG
jgi:hypothetical protein